MEFFLRMMREPSSNVFELRDLFSVLLLFLYLSFVGILATSVALSLLFSKKSKETSVKLGLLATSNGFNFLIFGLLPLFSYLVLWQLKLYNSRFSASIYFTLVFILDITAFFYLHFYRKKLNPLLGITALLLLSTGTFLFLTTLDLLIFPERWQLTAQIIPFPFYITFFFHSGQFFLISLILTGGLILLKIPPEKENGGNKTYSANNLCRTVAKFLMFIPSLLLPPVLVLDLSTIPGFALSPGNFAVNLLLTGICLLQFLYLTVSFLKKTEYNPYIVFVFGVLASFSFGLNITLLQSNAASDFYVMTEAKINSAQEDLLASRQILYEKSVKTDLELGKKVFEQRCMACHRWKADFIGPAYISVIPKYSAQPEKMYSFIRNPKKINEKFIVMPKLGLTETEIKSVTQYLLGRLDKEKQENRK